VRGHPIINIHGVMSKFLNLPGASRACMDFYDPTDLFRFNKESS
jgi:hypothetical protein